MEQIYELGMTEDEFFAVQGSGEFAWKLGEA